MHGFSELKSHLWHVSPTWNTCYQGKMSHAGVAFCAKSPHSPQPDVRQSFLWPDSQRLPLSALFAAQQSTRALLESHQRTAIVK